MKIGIIGTGRMSSGLGKRWADAGHEVMFGSREPAKAQALAAQIGGAAQGGSQADAVKFADVLLLATPFDQTEVALRGLGSLAGKVVIEITNNFVDHNPLSTTERIMQWSPGARVVKAFNGVFWQQIHAAPAPAEQHPDVFMAGDDNAAKQIAAQWIEAAGYHAVDAGPAKSARHLENLAFFIIEMAYGQGMGPGAGLKIVQVAA